MLKMPVCLFIAALMLSLDCSPAASQQTEITIENAFPNLTFTQPVFLTHSNDGSNRIFVVEQQGLIKVFPNDSAVTTGSLTIFADLASRMSKFHNEAGLLGLAFHPEYSQTGFFYVNYTRSNPRRTVISRFQVSTDNANQADMNSELIIVEIQQPAGNHNGGMIQFGPRDGYLYIAMGDGGGSNDVYNNGQNLQSLLGAILRIDVENTADGKNYGIPPDNPFFGNTNGWREEIWAYGLRNPWRFSIDSLSNEVWAGDVGQNRKEEVDLIQAGGNYGWPRMEGLDCFNQNSPNSPPSDCDKAELTLPIVDYGRSLGRSITGGYIYRGSRQPSLYGDYIYGDFVSSNIWTLRYQEGQVVASELLLTSNLLISSFGVDATGELYILDHRGQIYRFNKDTATSVTSKPQNIIKTFLLEQNFPNPFNPATRIRFSLLQDAEVRLIVLDVNGRQVKVLQSGYLKSGTHDLSWDGSSDNGEKVASGIYYYQLSDGFNTESQRMLLLR